MDRLACVDVPALALQLLLAAHPKWRGLPAAVVDADEPNGTVLEVNAKAWRARLRPGMRFASALSLDARLRAAAVPRATVEEATARIAAALGAHTPGVEPSPAQAGLFWLDASGLAALYASHEAWGRALLRAVAALGLQACVAVGFTRTGTWALARALHGGAPLATRAGSGAPPVASSLVVCANADDEKRRTGAVALEALGIEPKLVSALARLAVRTVGDFVRLPEDAVRRRFGADAAGLHRRLRGGAWEPFEPLAPQAPRRRSILLDDPATGTGLVLLLVGRLLADLLAQLGARGDGATRVAVTLRRRLRHEEDPVAFDVRTAEPTLDERVLVDLVRLRLEGEARRRLGSASVIEIEVEVEAAPAGQEQLRLLREGTGRDLAAGARALARVRAALGEGSVVRAVLRDGHLPEAGFAWEDAAEVRAPSPLLVRRRSLVRRLHARALALPPKPFRERDDCWIASAAGDGRVEEMAGPYVVSGGWWNREVCREYHYARTDRGEVLWVYYDRRRRRWFLAGSVE